MPDDVVLRPRDQVGVGALEGANSGMDLDALAAAQQLGSFMELGATGLKRAAGYLDEEFLPALRGRKGVEIFREMSLNDPTVAAMIFAIVRLVGNIDWRVEPAGKSKEDSDAAKLVETCMEDMSQSWKDFISEAMSSIIYGWSWHEVVYKRRVGPWEKDPRRRSKFSDGKVGIRKLPIRSQDTMMRWVFDEQGETRAMVQMAPPYYRSVVIPIERSLLFRYRQYKNSPEGLSMLRGAYQPWFYKKRLQEFEAIGVERDLAGLPVVKVPAEMLRAKPGTDQAKSVEAFKKLVRSTRRNEQEGVVFPQAYDQETKQPLYEFELLGGGGARAFNTTEIIERYDLAILQTVLADWLKVGHEATGAYSLHVDKTGVFRTALNSTAQAIADTLNRHLIPRLFAENNWRPAELPTIVPSDVDAPDITVLAQFMSQMQMMGVTWFPDGELENFLRAAARLPELDEDQLELRKRMQMRSEATMFAQANSDYVMAQQGLSDAVMGPSTGPTTGPLAGKAKQGPSPNGAKNPAVGPGGRPGAKAPARPGQPAARKAITR